MNGVWIQIASGFGGILAGVLIWLAVDRDLRDAVYWAITGKDRGDER